MPTDVPVLSPAEALALLGDGREPEALGVLAGRPLLVVDLDGDDLGGAAARRVADLCRLVPAVVAGVRRASVPDEDPPAFDLLLCEQADPPRPWVTGPSGDGLDDALALLRGAVEASPVAAAALAQVLRTGRRLDAAGALIVESVTYGALQAGTAHQAWLAAKPQRPGRAEGDEPAVLVDLRGDTLCLTLNRPWVRNAYNARMRDDLVAALAVAAADPALGVTIEGAGPSFCSGGDLAEFGTGRDVAANHIIRTTRSAGHLLYDLRHRTTVRVHGACVGAGIELPSFTGRIEADPASRFQLPEVSMGLIPGAGGTASIPRRIGPERTAWMGLTGQTVDAPTALRWGLVDAIVELPVPDLRRK